MGILSRLGLDVFVTTTQNPSRVVNVLNKFINRPELSGNAQQNVFIQSPNGLQELLPTTTRETIDIDKKELHIGGSVKLQLTKHDHIALTGNSTKAWRLGYHRDPDLSIFNSKDAKQQAQTVQTQTLETPSLETPSRKDNVVPKLQKILDTFEQQYDDTNLSPKAALNSTESFFENSLQKLLPFVKAPLFMPTLAYFISEIIVVVWCDQTQLFISIQPQLEAYCPELTPYFEELLLKDVASSESENEIYCNITYPLESVLKFSPKTIKSQNWFYEWPNKLTDEFVLRKFNEQKSKINSLSYNELLAALRYYRKSREEKLFLWYNTVRVVYMSMLLARIISSLLIYVLINGDFSICNSKMVFLIFCFLKKNFLILDSLQFIFLIIFSVFVSRGFLPRIAFYCHLFMIWFIKVALKKLRFICYSSFAC